MVNVVITCKICTDPATNDCIGDCYEQAGYGQACTKCGLEITIHVVVSLGAEVIIEGAKYVVKVIIHVVYGVSTVWAVLKSCQECMVESEIFENCIKSCPECTQWEAETCYVEY